MATVLFIILFWITNVSSDSTKDSNCLASVYTCSKSPRAGNARSAINGSWIQTLDISSCLSTASEIAIDQVTVSYIYDMNDAITSDLNITLELTLFVPYQLASFTTNDNYDITRKIATKQQTFTFIQAQTPTNTSVTFTDLSAQIGCNDKFNAGNLAVWVRFIDCASCDLSTAFDYIVPEVCNVTTPPTNGKLFGWNVVKPFLYLIINQVYTSIAHHIQDQRINIDIIYSHTLDCECDLQADQESGYCTNGDSISLKNGVSVTQIFDTTCFDSQLLSSIVIAIRYAAYSANPPTETFTFDIKHDNVIVDNITIIWSGEPHTSENPSTLYTNNLTFALNNEVFMGGCSGSSTYQWILTCSSCSDTSYYGDFLEIYILECEYGSSFIRSGTTLSSTINDPPLAPDFVFSPAFVLNTMNPFKCADNNTICTVECPTKQPTQQPTFNPTLYPSTQPTIDPTQVPSFNPSVNPTNNPSLEPTRDPTDDPTDSTFDPTQVPTIQPTYDPTNDPTFDPTIDPTIDPTNDPTIDPTIEPTVDPTVDPTIDPTVDPSVDPTIDPTNDPTFDPTVDPTKNPVTNEPSYEPTNTPTEPTVEMDDVCDKWSVIISFVIQTKESMNGEELNAILNPIFFNAFTKTIRKNTTLWDKDWCISVDILVNQASRRRQLLQSANVFSVAAEFQMNDVLHSDVFVDYNKDAFSASFEEQFIESLTKHDVINISEQAVIVSSWIVSDIASIELSTTATASLFVDVSDGITVVLYMIIAATVLIVVFGKINSKFGAGPDDFRLSFIMVFGLYTCDILSDCLFTISLYSGYIHNKHNNNMIYVVLFIASLIFIIMPIISNFRCLYIFIEKWTSNALHAERYKAWFLDYRTFVYALSLICGSTFGAIQFMNSNLVQHRFFVMGLTHFELNEFRQKRVVNVIIQENIPQLIIQCIFSYFSEGLSTISFLAIMSSIVSICVSFLDYLSKRKLLTDAQVTRSLFTVNVYLQLQNVNVYLVDYKYKTKKLGFEIAKMFVALDKKAIEVLPSKTVSHDEFGEGLMIMFEITTSIMNQLQLYQELVAASLSSLLAKQILKAWNINKVALITDDLQWIQKENVVEQKTVAIETQMSNMLLQEEQNTTIEDEEEDTAAAAARKSLSFV